MGIRDAAGRSVMGKRHKARKLPRYRRREARGSNAACCMVPDAPAGRKHRSLRSWACPDHQFRLRFG